MNAPANDPQPTEQQTADGQAAARRKSLHATMPPADVPGVRLERFLGAGAFGQVWIGRDLNTGRGVAVKFYLHRGGVNWSLLSREVKNLVQLSADRHVVQVLEVGWDADPPYYIMELIEGGSLEDLLLRRGRLPIADAVELFRKICIGLNHCHGKGVLHCDVKPANILLAADDEPRLADFGQSRMSHDQTPAMGTLFYMAPEQADLQSTPDARWDVYAAGAILYRMLAGNAPHRDQALLSQLDTAGSLPGRLARYREAIANAPPAMDQLTRRGVDRHLRQILGRCLEVDPKKRYANVQMILDDLRRRDLVTTRRPLLLLGIVGPLVLLLATCFFAARSIERAGESATIALRREAFGSNRLAARFAAQTLQTEIERYFRLAEDEARRAGFLTRLSDARGDAATAEALAELGSAGSSIAADAMREPRDRLIDAPARQQLDEYLSQRLALYTGMTPGPRRQQLATMFVADEAGTIFGIGYGEEVSRERSSVGRNYAFRTYFHGLDEDLPPETPLRNIKPLDATHLSSAFQSTATGLWKVAISTPIRLQPTPKDSETDDEADRRPVDAVFVITINLGDFQLLQNRDDAVEGEKQPSQIAALIEAREGDLRGTVLQHPLMDQLQHQGKGLSADRYQVEDSLLTDLLGGGDVTYRDPMAVVEGGEAYGGSWIAAVEPVSLPDSTDDRKSDLLVLVQYRLSDVLGPVGDLQRSLLREGAASVISILLVTLFLWWVVRRVTDLNHGDEVSDRDELTPAPEPMETIQVG